MQERVYRTMAVICALTAQVPVGTNLGLVRLLWMMLSGQLLVSRGGVIPGLNRLGLDARAVRRSWAALGTGAWTLARLLKAWQELVVGEGHWRPHCHGGLQPVAVDVTDFVRPRLKNCPTEHYNNLTGRSLPSIPIGLVARVGSVGGQRMGLPLGMVRADPTNPSRQAQNRDLVRQAVGFMEPADIAVFDRGFPLSLLHAEHCPRYLVRLFKNFTARQAQLPAWRGFGPRPKRGEVVRPLARTRKGKLFAATPADAVERWQEEGYELRAQWWLDLRLPEAARDAPSFQVVAIYDPRYEEPLLLGTPVRLAGAVARALYSDRWPVEQIPLSAKQMIGAHRQFVHATETRQRLPELTLLAGSVLTYLAATQPVIPTGFWDHHAKPTPGRLRRALAQYPFSECYVQNARIRQKASVTDHLPKGHLAPKPKKPAPPPLQPSSFSGN